MTTNESDGKTGEYISNAGNTYGGRGDCSLSIGWGSIFLGVVVHSPNSRWDFAPE